MNYSKDRCVLLALLLHKTGRIKILESFRVNRLHDSLKMLIVTFNSVRLVLLWLLRDDGVVLIGDEEKTFHENLIFSEEEEESLENVSASASRARLRN